VKTTAAAYLWGRTSSSTRVETAGEGKKAKKTTALIAPHYYAIEHELLVLVVVALSPSERLRPYSDRVRRVLIDLAPSLEHVRIDRCSS
jgi:hypothetical protein